VKEEIGSWLSGQNKISYFFFYLLIIFLPTQFGKHFFPNFSFVYGLRIDYLSPTIYVTDVLIILIFIFSSINIFKKLLKAYKREMLIFLIFTLFLTLGIPVSKNPLAGFLGLIKILEYVYLGVFTYLNFHKFNKKILAVSLGAGIIFESLLAIFQYFNQGSFQGIFYLLGERSFSGQTPGVANASINGRLILRPYATFSHPNVLAGYLDLGLILFLALRKHLNKIFILLVLTIGSLGILISFSRIAILSWVVFVICLFGTTIFEKYKKDNLNPNLFKNKYILLIFLVIIIFIFTKGNLIVQRFSSLRLSDESIVLREKLINNSFDLINKNPIFGVGINNYINNLDSSFNTPMLLQPVHNIFILVFVQTGIVGLSVFMFLFLAAFKNSLKSKKRIFKIGLLYSVIFIGMFDHYFLSIQQGQVMLTLILTYCISNKTNLIE
jgi:O-antigen ligase